MRREVSITGDRIDPAAMENSRTKSTTAGAVIVFLGVVRGTEEGARIQGLDYEASSKMAQHQFGLIFDRVEKQWPVESIRLIHRIGPVPAGEASLWVEVAAPHRGEAFAACQWLIDEMKRVVPIWKKKMVGAEGFEPPTYSV
jgi:molybdopterin synthase catalytic subunit